MSNRDSILSIATNIKMDKDYSNTLALSQNEIVALINSTGYNLYYGNDYMFLRTENKIKVQAAFSELFNANYCYIVNQGIIQFFFIDNVEYIADATTEITVTEDVLTTYKNRGFGVVYVERQHTQDDNILNLAQEKINFERYTRNKVKEIDVTPTKVMAEFSEYLEDSVGDPIFRPTTYPTIPQAERAGMTETGLIKDAPSMLYRAKGYIADPDTSDLITLNDGGLDRISTQMYDFNIHGHGSSLLGVKTYPPSGIIGTTTAALTDLDGYTPKNNKCLQYPYYYINFTNNKGNSNILKPEMFENRNSFAFSCANCCHGVVQSFAYPKQYNGQVDAWDFGLVIDNFPQLPLTVDSYAQYMAQRGNTAVAGVGSAAVAGGIGLIAGVATMNPLLAVGGAMGIASAVGDVISSAAFTPDNAGDGVIGRATGDFLNYCMDNFKFRIEHMTITAQDAKRIDDYFSAYGYAQNEIQQISVTNPRFYCHHVKTMSGEAVIEGIPHAKADIINRAFSRGITFWDSNENVGNYNLKS